MTPDREQLEHELHDYLNHAAPAPRPDALQRLERSIGMTVQRAGWLVHLRNLGFHASWLQAGVVVGVAAAALVVGVVIGRAILPLATDPAGSSMPPPLPSQSNRVTWDEPTSYVFVWEGCSDATAAGRFRVTVEDGHVVSFVGIDERSMGQEDAFDVESMPTIGYMIGRLNEAASRTEPVDLGGGRPRPTADLPSVRYESDPVDGHPTRIDIDWVPTAIDDEECYEILSYEPLEESD